MSRLRGWRLALACAAALVAVMGVAALVAADGDDGATVAARATTTSSTQPAATAAPSTSTAETSTTPSTSTTVKPAPAPAPSPTSSPAPPACPRPAAGSDFAGFGATEIVIENAEGSRRSCVLTADTSGQHQQGLMGQDDLDGYEGMLFRFPTAQEQSFWMRNTSIPLSIAFFAADGSLVSAVDMEPCGDSPDCPTYGSNGAAKFALEVVQGRLPAVGVTGGSRLASR